MELTDEEEIVTTEVCADFANMSLKVMRLEDSEYKHNLLAWLAASAKILTEIVGCKDESGKTSVS